MKKFVAALATSALLLAVLAPLVAAQGTRRYPMLVTKAVRWQTWGPNGPVGSAADTTNFNGAVTDTSAAIYIGDMNWDYYTNGPGGTAVNNVIRVNITGSGTADEVDSLYYRIDHSPDGVHWITPVASVMLNNQLGTQCGIDQNNTAAGTTINNLLTFNIKADLDAVALGTGSVVNGMWGHSPYIRLHIRSLASDVFNTARATISYVGMREGPSEPLEPKIITKQGRWQTWGPNGAVGAAADTAMLDGAAQDTTAAIDISDFDYLGGLAVGPGGFTPMAAVRVSVVGTGVMDNVDSVYYRVEQSPDGIHWQVPAATENLNTMTTILAGFDQGNAAVGTTVNNLVSFEALVDMDAADVASGSAINWNTGWGLQRYIRIVFRTLASDVLKGARLFVSYPAYRTGN